MKRIALTLLAIFLVAFPLFSQYVNIPDANFLAALIRVGIDTNEDGQISYAEAKEVNTLDVSAYWSTGEISDMTGIEAFTNLTHLQCGGNQITNLDVSYNLKLKMLMCYENRLTSLNVSNNAVLTDLHCAHNNLYSLDIARCNALTSLACDENLLYSLDVSKNTVLTSLSCWDNYLTSLDVSSNFALTSLNCGKNYLASLDFFNNTELTYLACDNNQLTSLNVSNNTALIGLSCGGNQLTSLDISNNFPYVEWPQVRDWAQLRFLILSNMPTLGQVCMEENLFYTLEYGNTNRCLIDTTGSPNVNFTMECSVDVEEEINSDLSIYPNPTNKFLTIETEHPDHYLIEINSLNGQQIFSGEMGGTTHQLDLSSFQSGVYFITIRSKDFVTTRKIIKL